MKSYKEILSELNEAKKPKGETVFNKKINRVPVLIVKEKGTNPFVVYIDGDKLDSFKSQKDAEKSAIKVIKELT
jgi:hypothetical protein|tara:strand:- start:984 stop:1205 length:222 start_codon:yes stop_codon:yes gene_type:complete